jgi:pimeloyl-ACP methyl ester carboxylesterase
VKVTLDDGTALAYDDTGSGERTLLMTHGLGCDRTFMAPQVAYFQDRYRVVNVDLRGHGESDKPDQDYHPDVQAEDLAQLCAKLGITKPVLVGHSLGGVVGLRLAHLHPDLLAALVSIDAAWAVPATVAEPPAASRRKGGVATTSSEAEVSAAAGMTTPIVSGARMA